MTSKLKRGQSVKILIDYDLFGTNVCGELGIFLKEDQNQKNLVYFPGVGEWGEFASEDLKALPGSIPKENLDFVSNIQTMKVTFPT